MKHRIAQYIVFLAIATLMPGIVLGKGYTTNAEGNIEVPMKLYKGYVIVVKGSIGGIDDLNFLIDTGAVPSVVDPKVIEKLGLKGTTEQLSVFTKNIQVQSVVVPNVGLGPIQTGELPVLVRDLYFIQRDLGMRIDAMIGFDVLARGNFEIHYKSKKIVFGPQGDAGPGIPFQIGPGYLLVPLQVGNEMLHLVVDTGAKELMLFETRVKDRLPDTNVSGGRTAANMVGQSELKRIELKDTSIGDTKLGGQRAYLLATAAEAVPDFDGLLGVTGLGLKSVYFDFEGRTISWTR